MDPGIPGLSAGESSDVSNGHRPGGLRRFRRRIWATVARSTDRRGRWRRKFALVSRWHRIVDRRADRRWRRRRQVDRLVLATTGCVSPGSAGCAVAAGTAGTTGTSGSAGTARGAGADTSVARSGVTRAGSPAEPTQAGQAPRCARGAADEPGSVRNRARVGGTTRAKVRDVQEHVDHVARSVCARAKRVDLRLISTAPGENHVASNVPPTMRHSNHRTYATPAIRRSIVR